MDEIATMSTAPPIADAAKDRGNPGARDNQAEAQFWRRYFAVYDTLNEAIPYRRMVERHVRLLDPQPGEHILDAGTGTGNIAVALLPSGARVVGVDFCPEALEICQRKAPANDFRFADLTDRLPFDDASFDKLACCNVIYTLRPEDHAHAVAELARVLKPGGRAAITVFKRGFRALAVYREMFRLQRAETGLFDTLARCARFSLATVRILSYVRRIKRQQSAGAYTFFEPEAYRALLEGAGFTVAQLETTLGDQCLLALVHKGRAHDQPAAGVAP